MKRFLYKDLIQHVPKKQVTLLVGARQVALQCISLANAFEVDFAPKETVK